MRVPRSILSAKPSAVWVANQSVLMEPVSVISCFFWSIFTYLQCYSGWAQLSNETFNRSCELGLWQHEVSGDRTRETHMVKVPPERQHRGKPAVQPITITCDVAPRQVRACQLWMIDDVIAGAANSYLPMTHDDQDYSTDSRAK